MDLHELLKLRSSDWIERNLLIRLNPRDLVRESLIESMIAGQSPHLAAKGVRDTTIWNETAKGLEGLRSQAYELEEQIYATLGHGIDVCVEQMIREGSVEIAPSRTRRLIAKAHSIGMQTETVTIVKLIRE